MEVDETVKQISSKDVNPQFLRARVQAAETAFAETEFSTPVIPSSNLVMEILKITMEIATAGDVAWTTGDQSSLALYDRTRTARARLSDVGVLAVHTTMGAPTTVPANQVVREYDLSDSNGNGVIFAKPSLFLGLLAGDTTGFEVIGDVLILYRLKRVSSAELIGAIQE